MEYEHIEHTFPPVWDAASEILILGTLPSVKSRENHFYYGHKQNRFWKVVAKLCEEPMALSSTSPANAAWSLEKLCEAWEKSIRGERQLETVMGTE